MQKKERRMKEGDLVKLKRGVSTKRGRPEIAKVVMVMTGIYDGGMILDRKLDGSRYWNKDDLELTNGIDFQKRL
jgi:hypothetical protein